MIEVQADRVPDERVFGTLARRTLADALADCEASLTGTTLRDTRLAFRFLETQCGILLVSRPASAAGPSWHNDPWED